MILKSSVKQLVERGFLFENERHQIPDIFANEACALVNSPVPAKRTLGACCLASLQCKQGIAHLLTQLQVEKKLYCKLALCDALVTYQDAAIPGLVNLLGKIDANQYKTIPLKPFGKKGYPLPRDIAARTLIRMGVKPLPHLKKVLKNGELYQISEALDALGYICFYHEEETSFDSVLHCFREHSSNLLIQWKAIRAMSAFNESRHWLNSLASQTLYPQLEAEALRSQEIINRRFK